MTHTLFHLPTLLNEGRAEVGSGGRWNNFYITIKKNSTVNVYHLLTAWDGHTTAQQGLVLASALHHLKYFLLLVFIYFVSDMSFHDMLLYLDIFHIAFSKQVAAKQPITV